VLVLGLTWLVLVLVWALVVLSFRVQLVEYFEHGGSHLSSLIGCEMYLKVKRIRVDSYHDGSFRVPGWVVLSLGCATDSPSGVLNLDFIRCGHGSMVSLTSGCCQCVC